MYNLKINEHQAEVLERALDLFSRIGMGQFKELLRTFELNKLRSYSDDNYLKIVDQIKRLLDDIHILLTELSPSGYFGITSNKIDDDFRVAFDIYQVIKHRLSWDRVPDGRIGIDFYDPLPASTEEHLAEFTRDDGQEESGP